MADKSNKPSILLAISILAMAASLAYFTFELSQFIRQIPDILTNVESTSEKIEPVLKEISQVRDLIPPILAEVSATREQIPAILEEVKGIRGTIRPILNEVEKTREQIPAVLDEVAAVREQLPSVLASVDSVSAEMKAYRPIASDALLQVDGIRKEMPVTLDRVDGMIDKARVAARDASSGMVTGALGGLITAPFRLVGNFGSSVMGLSSDEADDYAEEDLALVQEHAKDLVTVGKLNDSRSWKNLDTDQSFKISLKKIYSKDGQECRDLQVQSWAGSKVVLEKDIQLCLSEKGKWEYQ